MLITRDYGKKSLTHLQSAGTFKGGASDKNLVKKQHENEAIQDAACKGAHKAYAAMLSANKRQNRAEFYKNKYKNL